MKAKKLAEILLKNPETKIYFHNNEYETTLPFMKIKLCQAKIVK